MVSDGSWIVFGAIRGLFYRIYHVIPGIYAGKSNFYDLTRSFFVMLRGK